MKKKTICIDFDGVIHDYSKGWQGDDVFGSMIPNADLGTKALKKQGFTIIIFTTRPKTDALVKWLKDNKIVYDYINENPSQPKKSSGKLIADVYLDDRGITFRGTWDEWLIEQIVSFKSWCDENTSDLEKFCRKIFKVKDYGGHIWGK